MRKSSLAGDFTGVRAVFELFGKRVEILAHKACPSWVTLLRGVAAAKPWHMLAPNSTLIECYPSGETCSLGRCQTAYYR